MTNERHTPLTPLNGGIHLMIFQDRPSCCLAAPDEDENSPPHPIAPSSPQSFLMGEGEDEGGF
jgi:hypothetical protein